MGDLNDLQTCFNYHLVPPQMFRVDKHLIDVLISISLSHDELFQMHLSICFHITKIPS